MAKHAMTLMAVTALGGGVAQADPKAPDRTAKRASDSERAEAIVAYAPIAKPADKPTDPSKRQQPITPLVTKLGAPACGNVMLKSYGPPPAEDPLCPVIRNLRDLEQMYRNFESQLQKPAATAAPLTLAPAPRPGL